jgi:type IV secretory pathway component VirB8
MSDFLHGATMVSAAAIALFFLRSWRRARDRLFFLFGLAFALLALERLVLAFVTASHEFRPFVYLIRLSAFLFILAAIVDKNRADKRRR